MTVYIYYCALKELIDLNGHLDKESSNMNTLNPTANLRYSCYLENKKQYMQ